METTSTGLRQGPLRVALFSGNYNYTRDGANRALNRLVAHLLAEGMEVRVYSPTSKAPAFEGVGEIVSVPSISIPGRSEFRVALGLPRVIGQDVRRFKPDIVHVSAPDWLGTSAQFLAKALQVPIVASFHTRFETYFEFYGLRWLCEWAWRRQRDYYRRSDVVLVPNESMQSHVRDMGIADDRLRIWSRGVDPQEFNPDLRSLVWRHNHGFNDEEVVVLFFGRLVLEKGIANFIKTIRHLEKGGTPHRVLVVGKGPCEEKMRKALPNAIFTGELSGDELGQAVASADILVNPSSTEAFGNVNLEAMASGPAVVSADVGSAQSLIIHGQTGLLCKPEPAALAKAVRRLVINRVERRRLAQMALQASQSYRWDEVLTHVAQVYRELHEAKTSGSHAH